MRHFGHNSQKVLIMRSFFTEMEVPEEVVFSHPRVKAAVLTIAHLQSTEVAFQPVGGGRDGRVIEVGKHVR